MDKLGFISSISQERLIELITESDKLFAEGHAFVWLIISERYSAYPCIWTDEEKANSFYSQAIEDHGLDWKWGARKEILWRAGDLCDAFEKDSGVFKFTPDMLYYLENYA